MKKIVSIILIVIVTLFFIGCDNDDYEKDLNRALNKPYNELTKQEREMVNDYVEWEVENRD